MKQILRHRIVLLCIGLLTALSARAQQAPSEATNIRITTDEKTKRFVILYDLPAVQLGDSLYVEIETASGRRFRPVSVSGSVGKKLSPGRDKTIYWDVVRDKVQLDEEVEVVIRVVRSMMVARPGVDSPGATPVKSQPAAAAARPAPVSVVRKKSPLPVIGWVATAGLAAYAFSLSSSLNKDVDAYNQKTVASSLAEWNQAEDQRRNIDSRRGTFTIVAGAAAALAVANVVWLVARRSNHSRTAWQVQPGLDVSGKPAVRIGFVRAF